jgi:hypothetical protein
LPVNLSVYHYRIAKGNRPGPPGPEFRWHCLAELNIVLAFPSSTR